MSVFDPQGFETIIEYVMSSFFLPSVVRLSFPAVICCQGIALNKPGLKENRSTYFFDAKLRPLVHYFA